MIAARQVGVVQSISGRQPLLVFLERARSFGRPIVVGGRRQRRERKQATLAAPPRPVGAIVAAPRHGAGSWSGRAAMLTPQLRKYSRQAGRRLPTACRSSNARQADTCWSTAHGMAAYIRRAITAMMAGRGRLRQGTCSTAACTGWEKGSCRGAAGLVCTTRRRGRASYTRRNGHILQGKRPIRRCCSISPPPL